MSSVNSNLQSRFDQVTSIKSVLDEVIFDVCEGENCYLLVNTVNELCFDLILHGALPKPYYVSQKTKKNGIDAGLILESMNDGCSDLKENFQYLSVTSLDISSFIRSKEKVLCYKGVPITADIDIVGIAKPSNSQNFCICFEKEMGYFDASDRKIIERINNNFIERAFSKFHRKICFNIIQHGPLNCCPSIKIHDLNFPISVYGPKKYKKVLGMCESETKDNMRLFLEYNDTLQKHGYSMLLPSSWI